MHIKICTVRKDLLSELHLNELSFIVSNSLRGKSPDYSIRGRKYLI